MKTGQDFLTFFTLFFVALLNERFLYEQQQMVALYHVVLRAKEQKVLMKVQWKMMFTRRSSYQP